MKRVFVFISSLALVGLLAPVGLMADESSGTGTCVLDIEALREQGEHQGWTFTVGENSVTHIPLEDLCGLIIPDEIPQPPDTGEPLGRGWECELPVRFNWLDFGLPSIKNQGQCGSCWAFGSMGPMESNIMLREGYEVDLSEQWLVSCNQDGWGCGGGWISHDYHLCEGGSTDPCGGQGAVLEEDFPYKAKDLPCECPYDHPFCLHAWYFLSDGPYYAEIEDIKRAILEYGPISTIIYAGSAFQAYTGGVLNQHQSGKLNHIVGLVGWDDTQGENGIWYLRNSWGAGWGEDGYMRIEYECAYTGYWATPVDYRPMDCNGNQIPDEQDILSGDSQDCNANWVPDECEISGAPEDDCNNNQVPDICDLYACTSADCNGNLIPDECDISSGFSNDCNENIVPDECEVGHDQDCNENTVPDLCDIYTGYSTDCNLDYIPDDCQPEWDADCNDNGVMDICDIANNTSLDEDGNWVPDECQEAFYVPTPDYPTIQSAIDAAEDGDTVYVADGTYTGTGNRSLDFKGTRILIVRSENGPENCIIDVEGSGKGFYFHKGEPASARVEGFTIINAQHAFYFLDACSPTISNCIILHSTQNGVYSLRNCTPLVNSCVIAGSHSSGVNIQGSSPTISNCTIIGNRSGKGGGITVGQWGGVTRPIARNCIVRANEAPMGSQIAVGDMAALTVAYCNVEGGEDEVHLGNQSSLTWAQGNIDEDAQLVDPGHWDDNGTPGNPNDDFWVPGDCHLLPDSPCIDVGDPKADYTRQTDLEGQPRVMSGRADIGADEFALLGDLNCDGEIDGGDVNPFVLALSDPAGYEDWFPDCNYFNADCNSDGDVDFGDIKPFIELLAGP